MYQSVEIFRKIKWNNNLNVRQDRKYKKRINYTVRALNMPINSFFFCLLLLSSIRVSCRKCLYQVAKTILYLRSFSVCLQKRFYQLPGTGMCILLVCSETRYFVDLKHFSHVQHHFPRCGFNKVCHFFYCRVIVNLYLMLFGKLNLLYSF